LTRAAAEELIRECREERLTCVYANLDINDPVTLHVAAQSGFSIGDVRVVLERDLLSSGNRVVPGDGSYCCPDDPITPDDCLCLEAIGAAMAAVSRFTFDGRFPQKSARALYRSWVRNSIAGALADEVIVAREVHRRNPVGFATAKMTAGHPEIGLLGVAPAHRRKGVGSLLLERLCRYCGDRGARTLTVATQGRNAAALRLYQKNQFAVAQISIVFHIWVD